MKETFQKAAPLLLKIEEAGFEAYFVGGSVRDHILGKAIADVDIATSATPEEIKRIFPKTIDVGIEHGTIIVLFNGISYEVTTFRTEAEYVDFRRPTEVHFVRSLEEDLRRRDFTMNAIAMDKDGEFIDPYEGALAIKKQVIKTVGRAGDRFNEDALRMMRAVRFHSQLGFRIEEATLQALESYGSLLEKISVERKLAEFEKLLGGKYRKNALQLLADTGILNFLPGLSPYKKQIQQMTQLDCIELSIVEMWGLILFQIQISMNKAAEFLKEWKLPVKKIKAIQQLLFYLNDRMKNPWFTKAMFDAGEEILIGTERIFNVLHNDEINLNIESLLTKYHSLPIKQRSELQITGTDVQNWFQRTPGPWIKEILEEAEMAVLNGHVENHNNSLKEWLLRCNQN
ncbi:CCA tRNA nucleotidyltransferase [Cytobacillus depressus]|uniref:CCA-adding enzyme n=1 Tax=Cytobacillus depressus TaxID=1602942 RepID=A0A6L3V9E8_9BACI|nr:CCA tRNA nucleotidyltransferase [Cytobacillus depressus]KAB2338301.1 CCA tRNA nucleotidyltransferase [Cytobacillus depressus]